MRVKRGVHAAKKRRTTLERAAGYRGQRSRLFTKAKEQVTHSMVYAFNDRKDKKGDFRRLWIQRINAGCRAHGRAVQSQPSCSGDIADVAGVAGGRGSLAIVQHPRQ